MWGIRVGGITIQLLEGSGLESGFMITLVDFLFPWMRSKVTGCAERSLNSVCRSCLVEWCLFPNRAALLAIFTAKVTDESFLCKEPRARVPPPPRTHSPSLGLPPGHALLGPLGVGGQVVDELAAGFAGGLDGVLLLRTHGGGLHTSTPQTRRLPTTCGPARVSPPFIQTLST